MKPIIIVPPKVLNDEALTLLRENGLCVIVADDPSKVRFLDPIPSASSRTSIESAAVKLSRILLNGMWGNYSTSGVIGRDEFCKIFVDILVDGTPLQKGPTQAEVEKREYDAAHLDEVRKIAREDARKAKASSSQSAKSK